jgi:hypothetical protein
MSYFAKNLQIFSFFVNIYNYFHETQLKLSQNFLENTETKFSFQFYAKNNVAVKRNKNTEAKLCETMEKNPT